MSIIGPVPPPPPYVTKVELEPRGSGIILSGVITPVAPNQVRGLVATIANDDGSRSSITWFATAGEWQWRGWDLAIWIAPVNPGTYMVWLEIYGVEQGNSLCYFRVEAAVPVPIVPVPVPITVTPPEPTTWLPWPLNLAGDFFTALWENVKKAALAAGGLFGDLSDWIWRNIGTTLGWVWANVKDLPFRVFDIVQDRLSIWATWIKDESGKLLDTAIGGAETLFSGIVATLKDLLTPEAWLRPLIGAKDLLADLLAYILEFWYKVQEQAAAKFLAPFMRELRPLAEGYPSSLAIISEVEAPTSQVGAALGGAVVGGLVGALIGKPLEAMLAPIQHRANATYLPRILGQEDLVMLSWRRPERIAEWRLGAAKLGINPNMFVDLQEALRELPSVQDLRQMQLRGLRSPDLVYADLLAAGYRAGDAWNLQRSFPTLPGISDVIRFGVREAYSEEIAKAFQTDADFPSPMLPDTARIGLEPGEVRKFWRAHWELPSVGQVYEMYHRTTTNPIPGFSEEVKLPGGGTVYRIISLARVEELLRVQDVMPVWRDPLVRIAFTPFTRLDIRRLYRTGTFSLAQVYRAYIDLGYSPENAGIQTEFIVGLETEKTFDELESTLRGQARDGIVSESDALALLSTIPVPQRVRDESIRRLGIQIKGDRLIDLVSAWRQAYRTRAIDDGAFRSSLRALGVPDATIDHLLKVEQIRAGLDFADRAQAEVRATGSGIALSRYRDGVSTPSDLQGELMMLGYDGPQADRYRQIGTLGLSLDRIREEKTILDLQVRQRKIDLATYRSGLAKLLRNADLVDTYVRQEEARAKVQPPPKPDPELAALGAGTVLRRYKEGWITASQFAQEMALLGYEGEEIDRRRLLADLEYEYDWLQDSLGVMNIAFAKGAITAQEYTDELGTLGMQPARIQTHLAREQLRKAKTPSA